MSGVADIAYTAAVYATPDDCQTQTIFATICSHVHIADNLSGSELKSGVWVGYNHK